MILNVAEGALRRGSFASSVSHVVSTYDKGPGQNENDKALNSKRLYMHKQLSECVALALFVLPADVSRVYCGV